MKLSNNNIESIKDNLNKIFNINLGKMIIKN